MGLPDQLLGCISSARGPASFFGTTSKSRHQGHHPGTVPTDPEEPSSGQGGPPLKGDQIHWLGLFAGSSVNDCVGFATIHLAP